MPSLISSMRVPVCWLMTAMSSSVHSFTDASKIARGIAAYPSMEALDSAK
jgi:hypothetical protein